MTEHSSNNKRIAKNTLLLYPYDVYNGSGVVYESCGVKCTWN